MRYGLVASVLSSLPKGATYEYRYWRILIKSVHGSSLASISGFELFEKGNQIDLTTGGAGGIASEIYSALYPISAAFDDDINTKWASLDLVDTWIGYDFGVDAEIQITGLSLTPRNDGWIDQFPKEFYLQYSEDGVTWFDYAFFETAAPVLGTKQTLSFPLTSDIEVQDFSANLVYGGISEGGYVIINDLSANLVYGGPTFPGVVLNDLSANIVYGGP